jgi:ribonuclease P protein component
MATARLRLSRSSRIKQRGDFARAKAEGDRVVRGCLIANLHPRPAGSASRVGVVTSRKIGGAVQRARARRLLREVFRLHQNDLPRPLNVVLVARQSIAGKKLADVEQDFLWTLRKTKLTGTV